MSDKLHIGDNAAEFQDLLNANTDKNADSERRKKIIDQYSLKYGIDDEVADVLGQKIHIDYLPTIDTMLDANEIYNNSKDVVGAALFKIEKDHCLFLTDSGDINLLKHYKSHKSEADELADKLWDINDKEYPLQWTHITATVLSGSFATVFGQTYGDWRRSLKIPTPK